MNKMGKKNSPALIPVLGLCMMLIFLLLLFSIGCKPPEKKYCDDENRPLACYDLYVPVCGSDGKEYSNSCYACMYSEVKWYVKGRCK